MSTIYIDNQPHEVAEGQNLLQACLSLGYDVPYFCWHPAIHSVGACRQCAVKTFKDEKDTHGKIEMACMIPVRDGMRLSIDDPEAVELRKTVLEWLMVNHPHDCPVCDEGGECHLQDMTVMAGQTYRRFRFKKRTHENQNLGPFVMHEMNRCIQCYRCVRFYRDFAGGRDLEVFGWHDNVYFGRHADGVLESEFAGNLVEICPTGVFTDKTLAEHYTRKWDLQTAPSVCVHCGLGCNTIPGERYGQLRRVHNRFNAEVNGYFLCDRGRYGYEFVNGERIRASHTSPLVLEANENCKDVGATTRAASVSAPDTPAGGDKITQNGNQPEINDSIITTTSATVRRLAELVGGGAIGIGSPRASLESNYALRTLVGPERFFSAVPQTQTDLMSTIIHLMQTGSARIPSLREIESADAVFILGEDLTNVSPMADLAVRQTLRQKALKLADEVKVDQWHAYAVRDLMQQDFSPVFVATPAPTKLDEVSAGTFRGTPDDIAALGMAVAKAIGNHQPSINGYEDRCHGCVVGSRAGTNTAANYAAVAPNRIADALLAAQRPAIIAGPSCMSLEVLHAAAAVADALCNAGKQASLFFTAPHCNSTGLAMTAAPGLESALQELQNSTSKTLIVLEADLYHFAGNALAKALLVTAENIVVLDHTQTATAGRADLLLPVSTFAESSGTLVNNEGRAQRFYAVMPPPPPIQESWRWLAGAAAEMSKPMGQWRSLDDVAAAMAEELPQFAGIRDIAPPADFRIVDQKIPRQSARYSGRTAMHADTNVAEPQAPAADLDSPLAFSMEGYEGQPPEPLLGRYWSPGWNSVGALNKFQQEVGGPLRFSNPGKRLIEKNCKLQIANCKLNSNNNSNSSSKNNNNRSNNDKDTGKMPVLLMGETPMLRTTTKTKEEETTRGQDVRWLVVPAYHIFGSDELSSLSPAIASLMPAAYVGMNADDAARANLTEGQILDVRLSQDLFRATLRIVPGLPHGLTIVPVGLKDSPLVPVCELAKITAAPPTEVKPSQSPSGGRQ